MTAADFSHLEKYEPSAAKVVDCPLDDLRGDVKLRVKHAGKGNKPYKNALDKMNTKTGAIRRLMQGKEDERLANLALDDFRVLFARHVVDGWSGVIDTAGNAVEFNDENCLAFLRKLPDWIFRKVLNFCFDQSNFLDLPDAADLEEQAGN